VFPTTPGAIPTPTFATLLHALLRAENAPSAARLAEASDVPLRTLYRITHLVDRSVTFDVADAILTALDANELWHRPPLDAFLAPPNLRMPLLWPITQHQALARDQAMKRRDRRTTRPHQTRMRNVWRPWSEREGERSR